MVRKIEQPDGALIFDDTIEEKPYTDENEIVVGTSTTARTGRSRASTFSTAFTTLRA